MRRKGNYGEKSSKGVTKQIIGMIDQSYAEELSPALHRFVELYYSRVSDELLEKRTTADLMGLVMSHWRLLQKASTNQTLIQITNPEIDQDGWQSSHTVIQIVIMNMPFLIDSVRMELNRLGLSPLLMIYLGGIGVKRNKRGNIEEVVPYLSDLPGDIDVVAPLHIEIPKQTSIAVLNNIESELSRILLDVTLAFNDWGVMQDRLREMVSLFSQPDLSEIEESRNFMQWMLDDHWIFIGARDYSLTGQGDEQALHLVPGSGLGVLRNERKSKAYRHLADLPEQARLVMLQRKKRLLISKTRTRSTIHRYDDTDVIDVLLYDNTGKFIGIRQFVGLFTSSAYTNDPRTMPISRLQVAQVMERAGFPEKSHASKDLLHILKTFPRDDLFQASVDELFDLCMNILHLQERRQVRLFVREDAYSRYVSCFVYFPKDRFSTDLLHAITHELMDAFGGVDSTLDTFFSPSILVRVHYIIRLEPNCVLDYDIKEIEQSIIQVSYTWQDVLQESLREHYPVAEASRLYVKYAKAFPAGYQDVFTADRAVHDIEEIERLEDGLSIGMSFFKPYDVGSDYIRLKLYRHNATVPLSDAMPMLENMGFRVMREQAYCLLFEGQREVWINDFHMMLDALPFEVRQVRDIFYDAFKQVWLGHAENDSFNRLVLAAELGWRDVVILRAYSKFFQQLGFTFSHRYIADSLVNNASIARMLVQLFHLRFDPHEQATSKEVDEQVKLIYSALDTVHSLDEDRIVRYYIDVILATLRTNHYQKDSDGVYKSYVTFKLNPLELADVPEPRPKYEIFTYSASFEGVHLRADRVARGGIRWSDRKEDFRTEVLGLMKAQKVKNSLIVPSGAKGGFVLKANLSEASRAEIQQEAVRCYQLFVQGLLDVTDNYEGEKVVSQPDTRCYDDIDPYIVVAADKGTASFSDIANEISISRQYWLGDAFASGGSEGYDHKKMGITARGAWVSAESQFQELGINVNEDEITVVGIGDMSGDVFGNGMLISSHLKLVAAFNHMHIFLDPDPVPLDSFNERVRLFDMPGSSWADYNADRISAGGGVYSRSAKSIDISPQVKAMLSIDDNSLMPNDLIKAILRSPVDMIWNGGIGTYVKSSNEVNAKVGDRTNDGVRIDANQLAARVFVEGGNLGLTQLARIEFETIGGLINTDFIDNSAGVDCSDHEVNIKILLSKVIEDGKLTVGQRNKLLQKMTDEVADIVLQNNFNQNRLLSQAEFLSAEHIESYRHFLSYNEKLGNIDRQLEFLPSDKELLKRKADKKGLTKPELAVMSAYSNILIDRALSSEDLHADPSLREYVKFEFPTILRKRYSDYMHSHRLENQIIATQLSNRVLSNMGITFCHQLQQETGFDVPVVVKAYIAVEKIFNMNELCADIQSLDYQVDMKVQHQMTNDIVRMVRRSTRWLLRSYAGQIDIEQLVEKFSAHVSSLFRRMPKLIFGKDLKNFEKRRDMFLEKKVDEDIAHKVAIAHAMYHALNIARAVDDSGIELNMVAKTYFYLVDFLDLLWFRERINRYSVQSHWTTLAKSSYKYELDVAQRLLTEKILQHEGDLRTVAAKVKSWAGKYDPFISRWRAMLVGLRSSSVNDFSVISVAVKELVDIVNLSYE